MRPLSVVVAFALAACAAPRFHHLGSPAPTPAAIEVEQIALHWSNVYLISRGGEGILVDSGSPVDRDDLEAALTARGIHVRAVAITHAHADHAGCARWLQQRGAAIILGAGDVATAGRGRNEPLRPTGLLAALLATVFMFPFEPFTPELAVEREQDLAAYGFPELVVVPVAGHTAGSIAIVLGDRAFVGDMVKGGQVFASQPTEHLYQTDRLADHRALAGVIARGVTTLALGHAGPVAADDTTRWLADADDPGLQDALSLELDARGEKARGRDPQGTGGLRVRYVIGRAAGLGYLLGVDARAGWAGEGIGEIGLFPLGIAARSGGGDLVGLGAGITIDPSDRNHTRMNVELAGELGLGPVRLLARGGVGRAFVSSDATEASAFLGVRLGRDRAWGDFVAGKGPYVAATFHTDVNGVRLYGVALGIDLFASEAR